MRLGFHDIHKCNQKLAKDGNYTAIICKTLPFLPECSLIGQKEIEGK
jgi:hypothetical protein